MTSNEYITKEEFEKSIKLLEKKIKKNNKEQEQEQVENPKEKKSSTYNNYIKEQLSIVKKENPSFSHREAFIECTKKWNKLKEPVVEQNVETVHKVK